MKAVKDRIHDNMAVIKDHRAILDGCVQDAGLLPIEDVTLQTFVDRAKVLLEESNIAYYQGNEDRCEAKLNEVLNVVNAAKVWNKHFGL